MDTGGAHRPSVSVVVPVYNSTATLGELVARLRAVLAEAAAGSEIILVNDGSSDGSWRVIEELAAAHADVRGIDLLRNFGQHNALLAGIRAAEHGIIVTIDDDLQLPPEEIPKLLAALTEEFDVVYGARHKERYGLLRGLATRVTKLVLRPAMGDVASKTTAFRAFRTRLRDGFEQYHSPHPSVDVLLTWTTTRFTTVITRHEPRTQGESGYTLGKLMTHTFNMLTDYSTLPLQVASVIGFLFTLVGAGILVFVLVRYFMGDTLPGFTFLASSIAIFSGAQLLALGVIGEYLARIHFRTMGRPTYVVRREAGSEESSD